MKKTFPSKGVALLLGGSGDDEDDERDDDKDEPGEDLEAAFDDLTEALGVGEVKDKAAGIEALRAFIELCG